MPRISTSKPSAPNRHEENSREAVRHRPMRRLSVVATVAVCIAALAQAAPASAVSATSSWGAIAPAQTCTTSCESGYAGGFAGALSFPLQADLAVNNSTGNIYVTDTSNNRIEEFSSSGTFVDTWGWGVTGRNGFEICTISCSGGQAGGGAGQLSSPTGVAVDPSTGKVYVADTGNNRIDVFSSSGTFVETWGWGVSDGGSGFETCTSSCHAGIAGSGDGQLSSPGGLAVDSSEYVYVADTNNNRIIKFNSGGGLILTWGWGVSTGASSFEACISGCQTGISGGGAGQLSGPDGITVDPVSGNIYVADTLNNRIDEFSSSAGFIVTWGEGVSDGNPSIETCTASCQSGIGYFSAGAMWNPESVAVGNFEDVYVGDSFNSRIDVFSSSGSFIETFGWGVADGAGSFETCSSSCMPGNPGGGPGQMTNPGGLGVNTSSGNIYVADSGNYFYDPFCPCYASEGANNRVEEFSDTPSFVEAWGSGVVSVTQNCTSPCYAGVPVGGAGDANSPGGAALDTGGDLYVADTGNQRIDEWSSTGSFVRAWGEGVFDGNPLAGPETCTSLCYAGHENAGEGEFYNPADVAVDTSSGRVFVADTGNRRIQEFSSTGTFLQTWGWGVQDNKTQFEVCTSSCTYGWNNGGAGEFSSPSGVAVDSSTGNVYVVDDGTYGNRIQEFATNPSLSFTMTTGWGVNDGSPKLETCISFCQQGIAGPGAGQLSGPEGVAVNSGTGNLYIADTGNNRIDEFSSSGSFIRAWGWGVADGTTAAFQTCTSTCYAGISGGGAGQLASPTGVSVDSAGNLYIADTGNNRIDEFSSSGSFMQAWGWGVYDAKRQLETCSSSCTYGSSGGDVGELSSPLGVAADSATNVYVGDTGNNRIDVFAKNSTGVTVTAGSPTVTYGQGDVSVTYSTSSSPLCASGAPNPYCKTRPVNRVVACAYSGGVTPSILATA